MEWFIYFIAIFGGLVAGIINTLSGFGSAITLTILSEMMGLPGNLANGSNRIGVVAQGLSGSFSFYQNGKLKIKKHGLLIFCCFTGAMLGVWVALNVSNEQFRTVFKYLMIAVFFVLLIRPKRWLNPPDAHARLNPWLAIPMFLALGFYGGFIQMGMGVFFLLITVLIGKFNIIEANAVKGFTVLLYSIVVLAIFHNRGLVDWKAGGIIAIGQLMGGYFAANFASKFPKADIWAYRMLVIIVILAILQLFGVFAFIIG
ncbi:sulfite exporter TauE/SafE family protein [Portibacter marinus]|uniref:sulfite exporter TauE/SafE family protein n=1 Tax=Portibacter marinus TaxID=2898660 RepID=UPI001F15C702|nr:sulfite exporter TauE/SafE family protein [Portibacter marinus]